MGTRYNFLDNIINAQGIGNYIKVNVFDEYSQIIFVSLVVLLILFIVILYKYTFSKFNTDTLNKINYSTKLKLEPLPPCSTLPPELQYRLCDYYIASSFNTPNLGNQQLDYISADMIAKALTGGARFIQLPICAYSVDQETYPVIAQAQHGKQHITSLNTISTREALATIRDFAFKYIDNRANTEFKSNFNTDAITITSYNKINYPLIIQLKLHTQNDYVLNILYQDIKDILGKYLIDVATYTNYPIYLEKLCMLLNKIIIISTSGYETSKLVNIITPTLKLFQTLDSNKYFTTKELTPDTSDQYFKGLSMIKQRESYQYANNLSVIINELLDSGPDKTKQMSNPSSSLETHIIGNQELTDKLSIFNMVGMTLVEPVDDTVTDSTNYNPILPFTYGCQFVAMNYQTPDKYMDLYLKIFQKSSYVLKPSGLRLPITETELRDKLDKYTLSSSNILIHTKLNINPTFVYETESKLISLQPANSDNNSDTGNVIFAPVNDTRIALVNASKSSKADITNLFVIKPSPLSRSGGNHSSDLVIIASAANPDQVITIPENFIELGKQSTVQLDMLDNTNMTKLRYQSFYPERGVYLSERASAHSTNTNSSSVSFRLYNDLSEKNGRETGKNILYYLGLYAKQLRLLPQSEDKSLLTFRYSIINSKETIRIYHIIFGTLKVYNTGIISLSNEVEPENGSALQIIMVKDKGFGRTNTGVSRVVRIKSVSTNKYVSSRNNILSCDRDSSSLDDTTIFIISKNKATDNEYTIEDYNGYFVNGNANGVLNLKRDKAILSPEVKASDGKVIKAARVGPSLGNNKYFKFIVNYELS